MAHVGFGNIPRWDYQGVIPCCESLLLAHLTLKLEPKLTNICCLFGWWFHTFFMFIPIWGRFPFWLYNIFQMGWNHQLVVHHCFKGPICFLYCHFNVFLHLRPLKRWWKQMNDTWWSRWFNSWPNFIPDRWRSRLWPLKGSRKFTIPKKGHKLAELPGSSPFM